MTGNREIRLGFFTVFLFNFNYRNCKGHKMVKLILFSLVFFSNIEYKERGKAVSHLHSLFSLTLFSLNFLSSCFQTQRIILALLFYAPSRVTSFKCASKHPSVYMVILPFFNQLSCCTF